MGLFKKRQYSTDRFLKLRASALIAQVKAEASLINSSHTAESFERHFESIMQHLDELIDMSEKQNLYFVTSPRDDKNRIIKNMEATINDFINRAYLHTAALDGEDRAKQIELLIVGIESSQIFQRYLKASNREKLQQLRNKAVEFRKQAEVREYRKQARIAQENAQREFNNYLESIRVDEENWKRNQRGLLSIDDELEKVDDMDGYAFEEWCAELLRNSGFTDVSVTPRSKDQGVDVLAKKDDIKYAIQCKCYSSDIGNAPVQEIHAGKAFYGCQVGAVMTNQYFTKSAQELALKTGTLLWDRTKLTGMLESM